MDIKTLIAEAHKTAIEKGWYDIPFDIESALSEADSDLRKAWTNYFLNSCLMNIASEVGEACEAVRRGDMENLAEELSDVCIRIADTCGHFGIDLEKAITEKMAKNKTRPYMHGNKRL
jgi:NTP pyrophosphatase (non-canonical NTP hydrolase)